MTVNNSANKTIAAGNGAQTQFAFSFIGVAAAYIGVILTDSGGNQSVLTLGAGATQYQLALNQPVAGAIWGVGGTVTYNPSGTPVPAGSTLTIFRTLPLTQAISLQNQISLNGLGDGAETGLDTIEMQLQQVSENIGRAFTVPISDPAAPLPVPPVAQRANMGAAFDGNGNLVAGTTPATGFISTAMQPVVNAATLALGRAAFGLGGMAVEGIGAGLQDDGSGNARVNSAFVQDAGNTNVTAAFHLTDRIATGTMIYTLPRANTLWNGFAFEVYVAANTVTFTPNASDTILGLASGVSLQLARGFWYTIGTDAANAGNWFIAQQRAPVALMSTAQVFLGAQSATYTTPVGCRQIRARYCGGGGASGNNAANVGGNGGDSNFNSVVAAGGGGGVGNNGSTGGTGGLGGQAGTSTALVRRFQGQRGDAGASTSISTLNLAGARGGSTVFFGGGAQASGNGAGTAPIGHTGGGAGGFATGSGTGGAGAGGAGESVELIINNPAASYSFVLGAGGASIGNGSVAGADAQMIVDEYY